MGNTSSNLHNNGQRTRSHSFGSVTRTFRSLRRMLPARRVRPERQFERSEDFEAFESLLNEDFSIYNTSDSDRAEHLITIHVSCTENQRECNVYVSAYNNSGGKVIEATINQDCTRDSESECFLSFTQPQTGRVFNLRFLSPYSAKNIKAFLLHISRGPQGNP